MIMESRYIRIKIENRDVSFEVENEILEQSKKGIYRWIEKNKEIGGREGL